MTTETNTATETKPVKKSTAKKPKADKTTGGKAALAAGAQAIRDAEAAAQAKKGKKPAKNANKGASTQAKDGGKLELLPKVIVSKEDPAALVAQYVTMAADNSSLKINADTPIGAYVPIFDNIMGLGEKVQFLMGDLYNEGVKLYGGTFAELMASTGRPVSSLRQFGSIAGKIPAKLRSLHPAIKYNHLRQVAVIPELEDKKALLVEVVKAAKDGKAMTVKEVHAKVVEIVPPKAATKPKKAKATKEPKVLRDLTGDEHQSLLALEEAASSLDALIGGASFMLEIHVAERKPLIEKLERIARFAHQLAEM